ncbi:phosphonate transport system permease protein [Mameliella alba]|uniref:phosphonate ABC transporter, permease protein PhnE n=1 Tax=Mameliella alba TaxID=561184 RepID=UPI00088EB4E9|nr:phosphonate ABC transporter, permease protein PhnE [Mameliella alba]OWV46717.1 phosphonate ABC transporter, permease protein PhnE [Mameliella alba]PTR37626.1 phosphonate transport system permease protein [Mameliella alba]GGF49639.1 phosphonate ABC transporter, permease protein PhnE [Mameliella alba]SDD66047.1 phosphonate transport system permease protein [Mameliella alba]
MTDASLSMIDRQEAAQALFKRKRLISVAVPAVILLYLTYIFFAFDVMGLAERARLDNAMTLIRDTYSYKTHVTRANRSGEVTIAKEGERPATWPEGQSPNWVAIDGETVTIDLPRGHSVLFLPDQTAVYRHPEFGDITAKLDPSVTIDIPEDALPEWISYSRTRLDIRTEAGRLTMTRAKTEVFRYFFGWELFWFTLDSPYHGKPVWTLLFGPQIDADRSNIAGAWQDFWANPLWHHGKVAWAIGETILMAFLGTMGAALVALPLAFLAARNFTPVVVVRQLVRRVFDFVRGVDALIFTILLSRAFGPGPLTGALAILLTDTGSLGKLFSEALENVDQKQIEGVSSTGAKPLQRYRFGVIPQITPVLLSQVLYFLESNTRSATIIGAITGGGIGLMLTQAIITQKDWEEVSYYIVLIVLMVIFMDWLSGILRRRLIKGGGH